MYKPTKTSTLRVGQQFYMNERWGEEFTLGDLVEVVELTRKTVKLRVVSSNSGKPEGTVITMIR